MGLFDFGKKKDSRPNLGMPPRFDAPPISSSSVPQNMPNIPDDIPMQVPKFPDSQVQKNDVSFPSFSESQMQPTQLQSPNSSSPKVASVNFDELASELKSISAQMQKDPQNPFETESTEKSMTLSAGQIPDFGIKEGDDDHSKIRSDISIETPIYINVLDFAIILEDIAEIKNYATSTQNSFMRISNILKDKEIQFVNYDKLLEDIQKKLVYIDKLLFEN